jgi:hypothetical protein
MAIDGNTIDAIGVELERRSFYPIVLAIVYPIE